MLTSQRKKIILEKLAEDGQVLAKQLSEMFGLSEDTVRRDLRELDAEGLLQRVHGGALPVSSAIASFAERNQLESGAKRAIAKAAAALIAPGQVVIIDGGTTSAELVRQLPLNLNATIVTHSPSVARPGRSSHGGGDPDRRPAVQAFDRQRWRRRGGSDVAYSRRYLFYGRDRRAPHRGAEHRRSGRSLHQAGARARAAETVVLASAAKLNAASQYAIGDITLAHTIIVERATDDALIAPLQQAGVSVLKA